MDSAYAAKRGPVVVDFDYDRQAEAIAADWGIDARLLDQANWTLETVDGADGEIYGYNVRFDHDTPSEVLAQLGLDSGQLERELSLNAFDQPDEGSYGFGTYGSARYGDESYPVDEPFPDLNDFNDPEPDEAIARPVTGSNFSTSSFSNFTFGESTRSQTDADEDYLVTQDGIPIVDSEGNLITVGRRQAPDPNAAFREEMTARLARLEAALEVYTSNVPNRAHNGPPGLVDSDPIQRSDVTLLVDAVRELKETLKEERPDPRALEVKASLFWRVAADIAKWFGRKLDKAVDKAIDWGGPLGLAWAVANPHELQAALQAAGDTAASWAHYLHGLAP